MKMAKIILVEINFMDIRINIKVLKKQGYTTIQNIYPQFLGGILRNNKGDNIHKSEALKR